MCVHQGNTVATYYLRQHKLSCVLKWVRKKNCRYNKITCKKSFARAARRILSSWYFGPIPKKLATISVILNKLRDNCELN